MNRADHVYKRSPELRLGDALDSLQGLPSMQAGDVDVFVTDPVWPNRPPSLWPGVDADDLFRRAAIEMARIAKRRIVVILGSDTDPRFLRHVPASMPFVRVCWLRYALPSYNGTVLNGSVVAYVFGDARGPYLATLLPGEKTASTNGVPPGVSEVAHPCPRKPEHLEWLIRNFTDPDEVVCDPFAGSCTTGVAAVRLGRRFLGWEVDPLYHGPASKALGEAREQCDLFNRTRRRPKVQQGALWPARRRTSRGT